MAKKSSLSIRERLAFYTDRILSRGFIALLEVLIVAALLILFLASFILWLVTSKDELSFTESMWRNIKYVFTPEVPDFSDMGQTTGSFIITVIVIFFGLIISSGVVGIVTTWLLTYYEGLKDGFSPALGSGHTTIFGFNDMIYSLINEYSMDNDKGEKKRFVIVDEHLTRGEMEEKIRQLFNMSLSRLEKKNNFIILCRSVKRAGIEDLRRCRVQYSSSIVINDYSDETVLRKLMSVVTLLDREKEKDENFIFPTLVCIFREEYFANAAKNAFDKKYLRVFSLSNTVSSLIAKTCQQPGLSNVFLELVSYKGMEIYLHKASAVPDVIGKSFLDIFSSFDNAIPLGFYRTHLQEGEKYDTFFFTDAEKEEYRIDKDDYVILLAENEKITLKSDSSPSQSELSELLQQLDGDVKGRSNRSNSEKTPKRYLVIGYDESFDRLVLNIARDSEAYNKSSVIHLLYRNKREQRVKVARDRLLTDGIKGNVAEELETSHGKDSDGREIKDLRLLGTHIEFDCARTDNITTPILQRTLESTDNPYSHVVVLSDLKMGTEGADTEALLVCLYLKNLAKQFQNSGQSMDFDITAEIQNAQNANTMRIDCVSDYIVTSSIIAGIQAQISKSQGLYNVMKRILSSRGVSIELESMPDGLFADEQNSREIDFNALSHYFYCEETERKILLGMMEEDGHYYLCPPFGKDGKRIITIKPSTRFIVLKGRL